MNKKIKSLIVAGIIFTILISLYYLYTNPEIRFFIGTTAGLKDKPIITNNDFLVEEVLVGINSSTALTFLDNDILFLEKETGHIRHIKNGDLIKNPVWDFNVKMEGCECYTESGLLGITSVNSDVYVFVTEEIGIDKTIDENRIYKFLWKNDQLVNQTLLKTLPGYGTMHHGGAMTVDGNGKVFAVIGDQGVEFTLQNIDYNLNSNIGIIIEINPNIDVNVSSDMNNYYGVGIRNSFGLAIDPITNNLWSTENGTHEFDEINLTFPKYNSGWPYVLGPANDTQKENLKHPYYEYSDPEFSWEKTFAPTGISFVDQKWKKFSNHIFVGDCSGNLYKFQLNSSRDGFIFKDPNLQDLVLNENDSNNEIIFGKNFGCITDVEFSPVDQSLYVISYLNNGAIYKITPK
tara:strand:- start:5591 stop:6802 length:1212 start_codon:yes stop_codon:yes gene_type:complete